MKDLQELIPIVKNKIAVTKIYYIKTRYIYKDGREIVINDTSTFYSSMGKAREAIRFFEEKGAKIKGAVIEYTVEDKILEVGY